jgi:dipicolinate synthase subunit A
LEKYIIIAGDARARFVARRIANNSRHVKVFGEEAGDKASLLREIKNCDYLILPIPSLKDDKLIKTASCEEILLSDILKNLKKTAIIFMAMASNDVFGDFKVFDYSLSREFKILNSLPTAEGAINIAMQKSSGTVSKSRALILGFGLCGSAIGQMMQDMHAKVYALDNSAEACALAENMGISIIDEAEFLWTAPGFDFIFNTIPKEVLTPNIINRLDSECVIIDIASVPGIVGEIPEGINYTHARSIPAKYAPSSSAKFIADAVLAEVKRYG